MDIKIVLVCLLGSTSALKVNSIGTYAKCADHITANSTGFRCKACENNKIENLVTIMQGEGEPCILNGKKDADSPVLKLIQTQHLAPAICKSGEGPKYSWEHANHKGFTCEPKYQQFFVKKGLSGGSKATNFLKKLGFKKGIMREEIVDDNHVFPEPLEHGIKTYKFKTNDGLKNTVSEIHPKAGTCTEKSKCGLYVHLHALWENWDPSLPFCGNIPQYVTNDESCYAKLNTIVLIPQISSKSWRKLSWNPDAQGNYKEAYDNFLFPLVDKFLQEHPEIDRERVNIGGGSSGGNGALYGAMRRPDIFSIAVASDPCANRFLTDPEDLEMVANLPSELGPKRRLKKVVIARGDWSDVESICDDQGFTMDVVAPLAKKVKTEVLLYSGLGHGTWGHTFNQYPELQEALITGNGQGFF